jgi:hypothetical protein
MQVFRGHYIFFSLSLSLFIVKTTPIDDDGLIGSRKKRQSFFFPTQCMKRMILIETYAYNKDNATICGEDESNTDTCATN